MEHYPSAQPSRIEWIDDSSANIIYLDIEAATSALLSFTEADQQHIAPSQLRPAKQLSTQPQVHLQVRQAYITDVKKPRARDASRYYLMNPDKDPGYRPRRYDNKAAGRGRGDRPPKRRRSADEDASAPFDVSMYDDDADSLAKRVGDNSNNDHRGKRVRFGAGRSGDLFDSKPSRAAAPLSRPRSASPEPLADGDGRFGFTEPPASSRDPESSYGSRNRSNMYTGRDLFDSGPRPSLRDAAPASTKELFPNRSSPLKKSNADKELFANGGQGHHRRSDAFDASDVSADLFPKSSGGPHMDRLSPGRPRSRGLAERISGGPGSRDEARVKQPDAGMRIRGGGLGGVVVEENPGFTIKGVAKGLNPRVKELFPQKATPSGEPEKERDLFAGKMRRSVAPRRRAEDLFGV